MRRRRCRMRFRTPAPALSITLLSAGVASAQTPPLITTGGSPIGLETVVSGLGGPPPTLAFAPDGTRPLFPSPPNPGRVELCKSRAAVQATPQLRGGNAG